MKAKNLHSQRGQAAIVAILVILAVVLILVGGVGLLTTNDLRNLNNIVTSSQSYYVAESGLEDALLRISRNMDYNASYTLNVGADSTLVEVTGPSNALVITSKGNVNNRFRKLSVNLTASSTATNVAFNYGIQVGYGGLIMENSTVNGNVYSNGPITATHNDARILGTAISANAPSQSADQLNDSPASPPNSINFRDTSGTQDLAQSFVLSNTLPLSKIQLYLRKVGNPANATVYIRNNNSGNPGSTTYATGTLNASGVTGSYGWIDITFSSNPQLTAGITYWIVVDNSTQNSSNYYTVGANNTYASGQAKVGQLGGTWNATSPAGLDAYFRVYLGGVQGSITGNSSTAEGRMEITGDARAHTGTNLSVTGSLYCQTGSGNNKACDTSQPDPTAQNFPITDANIAEWQADAAAGGTISGNYTLINGATASLGPKKITGNMVLDNNVTLTLTGTVWVQGTITISNNAIVKLDPGYGTNGGTMLADGWINLSNNTIFQGSGQAGSYFLLITTNDCDGIGATSPSGLSCTTANSAIEVANNVGAVVIYASRGQVYVNNNGGAKEITGYKLHLANNASVSYETGLASAAFSSGPGGGYIVSDWIEIE